MCLQVFRTAGCCWNHHPKALLGCAACVRSAGLAGRGANRQRELHTFVSGILCMPRGVGPPVWVCSMQYMIVLWGSPVASLSGVKRSVGPLLVIAVEQHCWVLEGYLSITLVCPCTYLFGCSRDIYVPLQKQQ